jgi:hypothetical protein
VSYVPLIISPATPPKVTTFMRDVVDLHMSDLHTILRLPVPECNLTAACNFTAASALLGLIAGASVVLFDPTRGRKDRGILFTETVKLFYPWDTEPATGVTDPSVGADALYQTFRNPLAHTFGHSAKPVSISRFKGPGQPEAVLESIERATTRPVFELWNAPTLQVHSATPVRRGYEELIVDSLYWGVREMIRRLTEDCARMTVAEGYF